MSEQYPPLRRAVDARREELRQQDEWARRMQRQRDEHAARQAEWDDEDRREADAAKRYFGGLLLRDGRTVVTALQRAGRPTHTRRNPKLRDGGMQGWVIDASTEWRSHVHISGMGVEAEWVPTPGQGHYVVTGEMLAVNGLLLTAGPVSVNDTNAPRRRRVQYDLSSHEGLAAALQSGPDMTPLVVSNERAYLEARQRLTNFVIENQLQL